MEWPNYKLDQITKQFISGGTPSTKIKDYWQGDIPWITGADIVDAEVQLGRKFINQEAIENSASNIVPKGSILLVTRTGVGKIAQAPVDIAISQDLTGIIPKKNVDPRFLIAAIKTKMNILLAFQQGATIKGITRDVLKRLNIKLPPVSEQKRIIQILNQADALRRKRVEADKIAERIIPALFYKMFGDPVKLMHNKKSIRIDSMNIDLQNGFACGQKNIVGGIPHLRMNNIDDIGFLNLDLARTVPLKYKNEKYTLINGDILFMATNSEDKIGKSCVIYDVDDKIFLFSNHLTRIRLMDDSISPEYLSTYLHLLWQKKYYSKIAKRWVNQATVSNNSLGAIRVYIPDDSNKIEIFNNSFRSTIKLRKHRQHSEKEINKLFQTMLHKAFSGELTAKWREAHMQKLLREMEIQAQYLNEAKI